MSIAAAKLNYNARVTPNSDANWSSAKSRLYFVASLTAAAASLVLTTGVLAIYLGMLGAASLSNIGTIGVLSVIVGATILGSKWMKQSSAQMEISKRHQEAAKILDQIQSWTERDVRSFYSKNGLSVDRLSLDAKLALTQKSPAEPLRALLPLIARTQASLNLVEKYKRASKEATLGGSSGSQELQTLQKNIAAFYTMKAVQESVEAMALLQNLQEPTKEYLEFVYPRNISWSNKITNLFYYGAFVPKAHEVLRHADAREFRRVFLG